MSHQLIVRSPDLLRLQNEGYDVVVRGGLLLIRDIPYVTSGAAVLRGTLVSKLEIGGETTVKPTDHTAFWIGEHPCFASGAKLSTIEHPSGPQDLGHGTNVNFMFSAKADYHDYHHKMTTYIGRISGEATKIDPSATPRTFPVIVDDEGESVFHYVDTASTRAGIAAINERVKGQKIGIAGGGGTGSYILDLTAKAMVAEIHVFDDDTFYNHNAFRAPGAPSIEQLTTKPAKVDYHGDIYDRMRRGIIRHRVKLDSSNVALLDGLDFVFVCMDSGAPKRAVVERLVRNRTPFVEAGMGIVVTDDKLGGIVRVVCSTDESREAAAPHISYAEDDGGANEYATNIQIAELNALNATLAVIRWKQLFGIYHDTRNEHYRGYSIGSGEIVGEGST